MDDSADQSAIDGNGDASDYDVLTGGIYGANQDPFTAADDGTITNGTTGTGSAPSAGSTPAPNASTYTPPSWFSQLTGLVTTGATAANSALPLINGQPATGPGTAGQSAAASAAGKSNTGVLIGLGIGAAILLAVL